VPRSRKSAKDPEFTAIVAGNAQAFQGAGTSRAVDAGGLNWSCFQGSQDGLAHTICATPKYGRIVEVQHINAGRVDRIALDAFLGGVGLGVAALSKSFAHTLPPRSAGSSSGGEYRLAPLRATDTSWRRSCERRPRPCWPWTSSTSTAPSSS
jgi:hypothetical protein